MLARVLNSLITEKVYLMKNIRSKVLASSAFTFLFASPAYAGLQEIPEPSMLPLLGIAAVAFYIAKKRKK